MAACPFLFGPYVIKEPCPNIRRADAALNFITKHIFNNMKKFLLFAAAVLAFASCEKPAQDTPEPGTDPTEDVISINPKEKAFGNGGGSVDVKVTSSADWTLTSGNEYSWVTVSAKSGKNGATVKFDVEANETEQEQKAVFTFTCGKATATFNITLAATEEPEPPVEEPYLNSDTKSFALKENGGTIEVKVNTNIAYQFTPGDAWITFKESKDGNVEVFEIQALLEGTNSRNSKIMFTGNGNSLGFFVDVTQTRDSQGGGENPGNALITTVANMAGGRAYPDWQGNAAPFKAMTQFTFEALVNADGWATSKLSTIMGVENLFLLRAGDDGLATNQLQVAVDTEKLNSDAMLETGRWYHVAVTFDNGSLKLYLDGVEKGSKTITKKTEFDFAIAHTNEPGGWGATRCFWIGYSCEPSRCWAGKMSEVRIWNKALTSSEINAENHFYQVDPASAGLVAYWKFNEGQGHVVKDHTSNGNDLYGERNLKGSAGDQAGVSGTAAMEWATVSLPE